MPRCRVYSLELKVEVAQRLVNGESLSALHDELGIRRGVLYPARRLSQGGSRRPAIDRCVFR